jgi:diacylglycerol kinase (ATP)
MSDIAVFVNPRSGRGRASAVWQALRQGEPRLQGARVVDIADVNRAREELGRVLDGSVDLVLAIGGDGTIHLVGNVLLGAGLGSRVALGVIPAGTGSDLARSLGVPTKPRAALARALSGGRRAMDALLVEADDGRRRHVLNVASAGISGLVDQAVNALPRRGALAYLSATLGAVGRYRNVPCRVTVDDTVWHEGEILLVAIANGPVFGNGMRVAPGARLDDGAADVVLVGPIPRWQLPLRLPQIYLGSHVHAQFVRTGRAQRVRLEPLGPFPPFDTDGETFAAGAATITLLPNALLVPA